MRRAVETLLATLRFGEVDTEVLRTAWGASPPGELQRLVGHEECELWLYHRLKDLGLLDAPNPAFAAWLSARARLISTRTLLVDAQALATAALLNTLGVSHVMLKGCGIRRMGHRIGYAHARATNDVDVLVPSGTEQRVREAFLARGYRPSQYASFTPAGHYHLPPVINVLQVKVEIHTSLSRSLPPSRAWKRMATGAERVELAGGTRTAIPRPTELLWHSLTHAVGHGPRWFRLRALLDGAALWAGGDLVDWDEIRTRIDAHEIGDRQAAHLWLGGMRRLAGPLAEEGGMGPLPHGHLRRLLMWRMGVLTRASPQAWSEKLLTEGARSEFGFPLSPHVPGAGILRNTRRRAAALLARGRYVLLREGLEGD